MGAAWVGDWRRYSMLSTTLTVCLPAARQQKRSRCRVLRHACSPALRSLAPDTSRTGAVLARCACPRPPCGRNRAGVMAYIIAYAFFLDEGNIRHRFVSLIPYGIIALAWLTVYHQLDMAQRV